MGLRFDSRIYLRGKKKIDEFVRGVGELVAEYPFDSAGIFQRTLFSVARIS